MMILHLVISKGAKRSEKSPCRRQVTCSRENPPIILFILNILDILIQTTNNRPPDARPPPSRAESMPAPSARNVTYSSFRLRSRMSSGKSATARDRLVFLAIVTIAHNGNNLGVWENMEEEL